MASSRRHNSGDQSSQQRPSLAQLQSSRPSSRPALGDGNATASTVRRAAGKRSSSSAAAGGAGAGLGSGAVSGRPADSCGGNGGEGAGSGRPTGAACGSTNGGGQKTRPTKRPALVDRTNNNSGLPSSVAVDQADQCAPLAPSEGISIARDDTQSRSTEGKHADFLPETREIAAEAPKVPATVLSAAPHVRAVENWGRAAARVGRQGLRPNAGAAGAAALRRTPGGAVAASLPDAGTQARRSTPLRVAMGRASAPRVIATAVRNQRQHTQQPRMAVSGVNRGRGSVGRAVGRIRQRQVAAGGATARQPVEPREHARLDETGALAAQQLESTTEDECVTCGQAPCSGGADCGGEQAGNNMMVDGQEGVLRGDSGGEAMAGVSNVPGGSLTAEARDGSASSAAHATSKADVAIPTAAAAVAEQLPGNAAGSLMSHEALTSGTLGLMPVEHGQQTFISTASGSASPLMLPEDPFSIETELTLSTAPHLALQPQQHQRHQHEADAHAQGQEEVDGSEHLLGQQQQQQHEGPSQNGRFGSPVQASDTAMASLQRRAERSLHISGIVSQWRGGPAELSDIRDGVTDHDHQQAASGAWTSHRVSYNHGEQRQELQQGQHQDQHEQLRRQQDLHMEVAANQHGEHPAHFTGAGAAGGAGAVQHEHVQRDGVTGLPHATAEQFQLDAGQQHSWSHRQGQQAPRPGPQASAYTDIDRNVRDPQLCPAYAQEIFRNLRAAEVRQRPSTQYMEDLQTDINAGMRGILIDWLVEVADEYRLVSDTLYLTCAYVDRYLSLQQVPRGQLQLVGVACMLIAAKYEEIYAPQVDEFCYITDNTYQRNEVIFMERNVLNGLQFDLSYPTAKSFLRRFVRAAHADLQGLNGMVTVEFLGNYLAELTLVDYASLHFVPSLIAASAVFLAKLTIFPQLRPWTPTLQHYTGYSPSELKGCVTKLYDLQRNIAGCTLPAIREKYRQDRFLNVASITPVDRLEDSLFHDVL